MAKTPEQWLEEANPRAKSKGILKVFLGYAPGVGKTYTMLSEAIRRKARGEDVVVGVIETHGRKAVAELASELETMPRQKLDYKGTIFEEMDVDAIIARKPQVVLIDELAHTNIDGSKHRKRYEDIFEVLEHGIDVLSTLNVQHVESVTSTVRSITDIQVRETVPDWVLRKADEVVMIDVTPEALQTRMRRGDIYPKERVGRSLANFFRRGNLIALRELALRQVATVVDLSLISYMEGKQIEENWGVRERIAVCISSNPAAKSLISRAARMAQGLDAELYVVYVDIGADESPENQRTLNDNIRFAESLGGTVEKLKGSSVAKAVADFVRERRITEVIFGRSALSGWKRLLYLSAVQRFLRNAPPVDVHIVTQEE
jgi:two-component system, OmpR family, sensor histidine kinase KdpD